MANNRTELIFILDRSGSMSGLESDTVGGFNATLKSNAELPGECSVTTILFNHGIKLLHDRLPVKAVQPMTLHDFQPAGMTALLDAVGFALDKIEGVQRSLSPEYRADRVQFVIMTDGAENASHEYTGAVIRRRIEKARKELGWDFIFLGANIDAVTTARDMGMDESRAIDTFADHEGVQAQFAAVACANRMLRTAAMPTQAQDSSVFDAVRADHERRKG